MVSLHKNYGDVVKLEGLLFRKPMVILFKPEYCERMYRLETRQPKRESMEALNYYRRSNKHIFEKLGLATRFIKFENFVSPITSKEKILF